MRISLTACAVLMLLVGCAKDKDSGATTDRSSFLLENEPNGAVDVIKVRKDAADGDDVVIVGRIGGSVDPWIEGRAAFSIVDNSLKSCMEDGCETPWDYCCSDNLATSTALVKVVDQNGLLVKSDARKLLKVKELSTVVVKGKAERDEAGNLVVLANGIFVKE